MQIGGKSIAPGERVRVELPVARLPTLTMLHLPVTVVRGVREGPGLFLTAALHGDEVNGVEIIRRVLLQVDPRRLVGTLFAVPVVNVFGFIHQSRYLPDRRDLNRSFPGSPRGSLAARLAHTLLQEVVRHCRYGIDFHTGSLYRSNHPHVRADLDDPETRSLAGAFGAPIVLHAAPPAGTLRGAACRQGVRVLVYEGGEVLRFDAGVLEVGTAGALRVLGRLEMIEPALAPAGVPSREARRSQWVRAPRGGILRLAVRLGDGVSRGQPIGLLAGPLGEHEARLRSPVAGTVIGLTDNPLVNRGDAVAHIALEVVEPDPPDRRNER